MPENHRFLNLLAGGKGGVTDIAGTTARDVLEENLVLKGISLRILDTAGIKQRIQSRKSVWTVTLEHAKDADLISLRGGCIRALDENDAKIIPKS